MLVKYITFSPFTNHNTKLSQENVPLTLENKWTLDLSRSDSTTVRYVCILSCDYFQDPDEMIYTDNGS